MLISDAHSQRNLHGLRALYHRSRLCLGSRRRLRSDLSRLLALALPGQRHAAGKAAAVALILLSLSAGRTDAYCYSPVGCRCYLSPSLLRELCYNRDAPPPRIPPEWDRSREFRRWKDPDRPREFWPPPPNPWWPR